MGFKKCSRYPVHPSMTAKDLDFMANKVEEAI